MENEKLELLNIIESLHNPKQITYLLNLVKGFLKLRS